VVPAAERIGVLSYEETQELAESGAKVLNAQAVEFAKEKGIAIYARATSGALPGKDPSLDGTVVRKLAPRLPGSVVGVASEKEVLLIQSRNITGLLQIMDDFGCPGKQLHMSSTGGDQDGLTLVVSKENLHQGPKLQVQLTKQDPGAHWNDAIGAVSIIGAGINASHDKVRRGSQALEQAGIRYHTLATSSFRVTWLVDRQKVEEAVRLLHRLFIEAKEPVVPLE
jgi:aspartate kinase